MGVSTIGEQVASEQSKRSEQATCRSYYSCCTVLLLSCSLLHYKSRILSTWVSLPSNRVGVLSNGVGLFSRERVLDNTPTPSLSSHLSSLPMGVFSRDYGTSIEAWSRPLRTISTGRGFPRHLHVVRASLQSFHRVIQITPMVQPVFIHPLLGI